MNIVIALLLAVIAGLALAAFDRAFLQAPKKSVLDEPVHYDTFINIEL